MKLVNFASFDPLHQNRGVSGLKNTSQADMAIWREFDSNWAQLGAESEQSYRRLLGQDDEAGKETKPAEERPPETTLRETECRDCLP